MISAEIRIVKRRLDDYQSYKDLASYADRQALMTQVEIEQAGQPRSPRWDKVAPTQNHLELSSYLNELISEQAQYEREAAGYRLKMQAIEAYIDANFDGPTRDLVKRHYIDGIRYDDLRDEMDLSPAAMVNSVTRAMEDLEFDQAKCLI